MPLGGYCSVCARWVWLTPYGECQNGHPASAVRDVQQLKPQTQPAVVVDAGWPRVCAGARASAGGGATRCGSRWTFTAGFLNWVVVRLHRRARPACCRGRCSASSTSSPLVLTILAIGTPLFQRR